MILTRLLVPFFIFLSLFSTVRKANGAVVHSCFDARSGSIFGTTMGVSNDVVKEKEMGKITLQNTSQSNQTRPSKSITLSTTSSAESRERKKITRIFRALKASAAASSNTSQEKPASTSLPLSISDQEQAFCTFDDMYDSEDLDETPTPSIKETSELSTSIDLHNQAVYCERGEGVPQNYAHARALFQQAAELELAESMYCLGAYYEHALGGEKDMNLARKWYKRAAKQNHPHAQKCLAKLYEQACEGVITLQAKSGNAEKWYCHATANGDKESLVCLADWYLKKARLETQRSSKQDLYHKAVERYQQAAEQGNLEAMRNLGILHATGDNLEENTLLNPSKAVQWFQKAADLGHAPSLYELGVFFDAGIGVTQADPTKAF